MCVFTKPWHVIGTWDFQAVGAMAMVVVVGTVLSFSFYMEGVRIIGATSKSLCLCGTGNSDGGYCPDNAYCLYVAGLFWNSLYYGSGSDTVN